MRTFVSCEEARATVCARTEKLPDQHIVLADALGRILAQEVQAREDVPPFDNSAMDGYVIAADDITRPPITLKVKGEIAAGNVAKNPVTKGICFGIMTGAPVPAGAGAVIPVEWTQAAGSSHVVIERMPTTGQYIRSAGEDTLEGAVVVQPGTRITPTTIGTIAAAGHAKVYASAIPRVSLITTGDEVYAAGGRLPPGKIRDANGPALAAQVRYAGGQVAGMFHARDRREEVATTFKHAMRAADMIIFTGGVSVGNYDFVNEVLEEAGITRHFWRVRQRPGGPLSFGTGGDHVVFGLPGNPVSSFICFEQYVRLALECMMGIPCEAPNLHKAVLTTAIAKKAGLLHFVRGVAERDSTGLLHVRTTGPQGSNLYSSAAAANCLIHLPEQWVNPEAGQEVDIEWLAWATSY